MKVEPPTPAAATLPEAVQGWSRLMGEEPALIFPSDWRWGWSSWRELARSMARDVTLLEALPPGGVVAFPYRPTPRTLSLELALQATGRVPLPLTGIEPPDVPELLRVGGATAWATVGGGAPAGLDVALPGLVLPGEESGVAERPPGDARVPANPDGSTAGVDVCSGREPAAAGVCVRAATTGLQAGRRLGATQVLDQGVLARCADALGTHVEPGTGRAIALVCGPLEELPERLWLAWGIRSGAALVLAPEPASTAWSLFWSRPTAACLSASLLPRVRGFLQREARPRPLRRRLRRLRTLLVWGEPAPGETEAWAEMGVPLTPFPTLPECTLE